MKKISVWVMVALFAIPLALFQGCAAEKALKVEKSLPQSNLAYYSDSFDKLRDDIWNKAASLPKKAQLSNFKAADMTIENGQLKIVTKTGSFSKGAVASRYVIRGDFDVQVDCHMDFLDSIDDMDQLLSFGVHEARKEFKDAESVIIQLKKTGGSFEGMIESASRKWNGFNFGQRQEMDTFQFTKNDVGCGFLLQNFSGKRESIAAKSHIQARFDNFRINVAQEIIEEEI
ncbi:hypothetical protein DRH13_03545 [Candidatus Woesebacteria bacterium]|nr:MAG: hypothetical protein DRH13_03545 [Candidatus Woesebacteria bacterium]